MYTYHVLHLTFESSVLPPPVTLNVNTSYSDVYICVNTLLKAKMTKHKLKVNQCLARDKYWYSIWDQIPIQNGKIIVSKKLSTVLYHLRFEKYEIALFTTWSSISSLYICKIFKADSAKLNTTQLLGGSQYC